MSAALAGRRKKKQQQARKEEGEHVFKKEEDQDNDPLFNEEERRILSPFYRRLLGDSEPGLMEQREVNYVQTYYESDSSPGQSPAS